MSTRALSLAALTAIGGLVAVNTLTKPSRTQSIAEGMREQLDDINSVVGRSSMRDGDHVVQNRRDTLLDRTELMERAKKGRPWNMTYAERREAAEREERMR